jgi:hypothetical protein
MKSIMHIKYTAKINILIKILIIIASNLNVYKLRNFCLINMQLARASILFIAYNNILVLNTLTCLKEF